MVHPCRPTPDPGMSSADTENVSDVTSKFKATLSTLTPQRQRFVLIRLAEPELHDFECVVKAGFTERSKKLIARKLKYDVSVQTAIGWGSQLPVSIRQEIDVQPNLKRKEIRVLRSSRSLALRLQTEPHTGPLPKGLIVNENARGSQRKWDHVALYTYVFERMAEGELVSHILARLGLRQGQFWRMCNEDDPSFAVAYAKTRKLQARAIANKIQDIAEGKDPASEQLKKRMDDLFAMFVAKKDPTALDFIRELDRNLIARNKLQLDAAKWFVKTLDPETYGDKQELSSPPNRPFSMEVMFVAPIKRVQDG